MAKMKRQRSMESREIRCVTQERLPIGSKPPTRTEAIEALRELGVFGSFKGIELDEAVAMKSNRKDGTVLYNLVWVGERRAINALMKEYLDLLAEEGE